ncbi:MAG: PAS domain S-box protein [Chloroflexi bacterium]|nr:MAG: PAS domain S-box protein [Chloroflexota bacterium]
MQEQADLAASEAMLRNIFQAVPLGVVMVQDRIITFSNSKISRMLGFGKDELIGQSARILYPDGEEFFRVGQEKYPILSEKGAASIETRFQKKNGKVIDILMHSTPLDPLDISAGVISTAINITEQKEMESALRKNEARYRNIFETTAVSIWEEDFSAVKAAIGAKKAEGVTDFRTYFDTHPDFLLQQLELIKIVDVNEAAVKMYKAASKEELMNSLERTFVPESLATFKEEIVAIAEGKPHFTAEGVTKALDGERVEVIVTMTFPKEAALWENVTVGMVDITERNRVAAALRESEDRLSKIRIAANDGTWDWNLKTNHLYFDPRYYEMAGYDVNEFPHRFEEFQKRIHPDDAFIVMDQARKHLGKEIDRFDVEFRFKKKDDSWLWILGKGVVVEWDKYGDPVRFLGTHTDIMDRKLAEDSLQKYAKRLETLQKVTAVLTTTLALEEVLSNILEQLALVIDFDNTTIFLREGNQVRMVTLQGDIYPQQLIGKLYPLDNPLFLEIQTTAQTLCLADVQVDPRFQNWGDVNEVHGWMGVPLLVRDELIGFLTLDSYQVDIYGLDEAEMVRPFADQAAQAIENARLHEQVKRNVAELDERVRERTEKLNMLVSAMTGREVRMAELKKVIKKLRKQLKDAGIKPIANDPLIAD